MVEEVSRREMLGWLGGAALGGLGMGVFAAGEGLAAKRKNVPRAEPPAKGQLWVPHRLDAAQCAPLAYDGYWEDGLGCCYGAFHSIIGTLGRKYGAPYDQFPFRMMEVGKSGISDWGTVCGALLGAASALALFWGRKERDPMVTELFRWYEKTALPIFEPGQAKGVAGSLPTHVSGSVLCHLSVSTWRHERCARVTADVAAKAIEIMNARLDGSFAPLLKSRAEAGCLDCHGKGKASPILKGRMDCTPCHPDGVHVQDKFRNHP